MPGQVGTGVGKFIGCPQPPAADPCPQDSALPGPPFDVYDGGAVMFINTSAAAGVNGGAGEPIPISVPTITVCVPGAKTDTCANPARAAGLPFNCFFEPWGRGPIDVPAGDGTATRPPSPGSNELILTQNGDKSTAPWGPPGTACNVISAPGNFTENVDTSETVPSGNLRTIRGVPECPQTTDGIIPLVRWQSAGPTGALQARTARDTQMVLTGGGIDLGCFDLNETSVPNTFVPLS
jgi:hypothetical protein